MKRYASSLAHTVGMGLMLVVSSAACDGTAPGGQVDTTSTITSNSSGTLITADTVAALKSIPSNSLKSTTAYVLRGYYALGDTLEGTLAWAPQSSAAADDIFVFKPNCVGAGKGRFIRIEGGTFDARKGGLKMDGSPGQGAKLAAIYTASNNYTGLAGGGTNGAVIDQLWLGPGTLNVNDGVILPAGTANGGASKSIGLSGAGQLATTVVGNPHGSLASKMNVWSTLAESEKGYGAHTWTQDLSEGAAGGSAVLAGGGVYTFPGVTAAADFAPGDWVYVRLGVDPTNQLLPFETLLTQVTAVSGDAVTVASPVHEAIPAVVSIPQSGQPRAWDKHDLIKITALFNGFEVSALSLDNVQVDINKTIATHVHDVDIAYGTATFSASFDENTVVERLTAGTITGAPVEGSMHYGWFYQGKTHRNTVLKDLDIHLLDGVPFFSAEGQSRGMAIGNATINIDSRTSPEGALALAISGSDPVHFSNLALTGYGSTTFFGATVDGLSVTGSAGLPNYKNLDVMILGSEITDYLFFNGKQFDQIQTATTMTVPLTPSSTIVVPYPLKGVPRQVRIRASTLTGVQVAQQAYNITNSIAGSLVAGQFAEPRTCTLMGGNFPAGGASESQRLVISPDDTLPPGSYVEVQSEFWTSASEANIQPPVQLVGAGAPSVSADFVRQRYYDSLAGAFYQSIRSGLGSADWVLAGP